MPRIAPLKRDELEQYAPMFTQLEEFFGFLPNDYLTMARKKGLLEAVSTLTEVCLFAESDLPMDLRLMICYVSSRAAGCQYCTSHTAELVGKFGASMDKIQKVLEYQTHPEFTDSERAALRIAHGANQIPNAVTDEDFLDAKNHFSEQEVVDIVSLISMMSVYNKWNDTMATTLEQPPKSFAEKNFRQDDWKIGKHQS